MSIAGLMWPSDQRPASPEMDRLAAWIEDQLSQAYEAYSIEHGIGDFREGPSLTMHEFAILVAAFDSKDWSAVAQHLRVGKGSARFNQVIAGLIEYGGFTNAADLSLHEGAALELELQLIRGLLKQAFPAQSKKKVENLAFALLGKLRPAGTKHSQKDREKLARLTHYGRDKRRQSLRDLVNSVRLDPPEN